VTSQIFIYSMSNIVTRWIL